MNKKFTFMVAALLAAGGFSANAQVTIDKDHVKGEYYYVVLESDAQITEESGLTNNDYLFASKLSSDGKTLSYSTNVTYAAKSDADLWKVTAKEVTEDGKKVTKLTLVNKETGKTLAYNTYTGNFVTNVEEYTTVGNLVKEFQLDKTEGSLIVASGKELTGDQTATVLTANGAKIYLAEAAAATATVEELQNLGTGVKFDFAGTIEGEDLFSNVSVVTVTDKTTGQQFLLQVGKAKTTNYTSITSDDFKNAEFIVLTNAEVVEGKSNKTNGTGFKYAKVKGENLVVATAAGKDVARTAVESGKYPLQNAYFTAEKNANKEGQLRFKQAEFWLPTSGENQVWAEVEGLNAYVGYTDGGVAGAAAKLTSATTGVWAELSGGSAVDVKQLVKGKKLVYILTNVDESSSFDKLLYSTRDKEAWTVNLATTNSQKNYVYSQWYVSAGSDNTVTLINRETGVTIEGINLFQTAGTNVYSAKSLTNENVNGKYLKFVDVEGATQFDGYVNLSEAELEDSYYLNSVAKLADAFDVDVTLVPGDKPENKTDKQEVALSTDTKKSLKWKFALATKEVEDENGKAVNVVDTLYQITKYNYYSAGKLKSASDTLKVFKYNLSVVNPAEHTYGTEKVKFTSLNEDMKLADATVKDFTASSFILRKSGDKFVIANAAETLVEALGEGAYNSSTVIAPNAATKEKSQLLFTKKAVESAPQYAVPETHFALEIGGAYLGANAKETGILTNDTSMLKSTEVDSSFSFWAFSADKKESKTPSYYLSTNGKMMYNPSDSIKAITDKINALDEIFEADKIAALYSEKAQYVNGDPKKSSEALVKFQQAKYVNADSIYVAGKGINGDALKPFKFNVEEVDGQAVLKNGDKYVAVVNGVAVLRANDAAKFNVVDAATPTSNETVSASEVAVVANNGSIVVKNAAGKNVVVSTILGQVVANEVLTSDNATINVPAGIVIVSVEGESFKVNVK